MTFVCEKDCFANKKKNECGILKEPATDENGECPFQKPKGEVTNGRFYPPRNYDNVGENNVPLEKVKRPLSEFAEEWDTVTKGILAAAHASTGDSDES